LKKSIKHKSIGIATLKTLGTQYSMYSDMLRQVSALYAEFDAELSQALSMVHQKQHQAHQAQKKDVGTDLKSCDVSTSDKENSGQAGDKSNQQEQENISVSADQPTWLKKLFKKIAIHCHPDKVLPSNFDVVEKHQRMASYDKARKALDSCDEPLLISVGLIYNEIAEIGIPQSKKILASGVKSLEGDLNAKQSDLVWSWGMSEDNLDIKAKILIHAAAQFYNIKLSDEQALKVIKEFFEIYEPKGRRKIGQHPGARLKTVRGKK
jgi:hypothetical protein